MGPPPARQNSITLSGSQSNLDEDIKDELVYKLSVANAQLEKENRIMRLHMLDMRKVLKDCKGANFTTDLQRAYRLSDLKQLRGPSSRHHHRRGSIADQQAGEQQQQGQQQGQQAEEGEEGPAEQQEQQPASSKLEAANPVNPASTTANPVPTIGNPTSGRQNLQP